MDKYIQCLALSQYENTNLSDIHVHELFLMQSHEVCQEYL